MPTPSEYSADVTTHITRSLNVNLTNTLTLIDHARAEVKAILSTRAGTGADYNAAVTLLTSNTMNDIRAARLHAILATPA